MKIGQMLKQIYKTSAFILLALLVTKLIFLFLQYESLDAFVSNVSLKAIVWGFRFDLAALAILSLPVVMAVLFNFNSSAIKAILILVVFWVVGTTLSDTVYLLDSSRHLTFEVFTGEGSFYGLLATLVTKYLILTLVAILLLIVLIAFATRLRLSTHTSPWPQRGVFFLGWFLVALTFVRGGYSDVPQSPMTTFEIGNNQQALIAWSAPYSISYYLIKGPKKAAHKVTAQSSGTDKQLVINELVQKKTFIAPQRESNIIVVLLESWTSLDELDEVMPNFIKQRSQSLSTQKFFANGYRTVEGLFSTFCSYPNPVGGGVAGTQLQSFEYQCLPKILKDHGWQTHFIQGSYRGIVGSYAQSIGFKHSYGKSDYSFEGTHNYWGYMDDDIFRFSLQVIAEARAPYLVTINTGTNHDSYLPNDDDYIFGKDTRENIRRSVTHHSDAALGRFIEMLEDTIKEPTLIVFVADHTTGEGNELLEKNIIPFLMYATDDSISPGVLPINAGQFDVAPSIMDWLGGNVPWFSGSSLLDKDYTGATSYSYGTTVSWIRNDKLILFDSSQHQAPAECHRIQQNSLHTMPIDCETSSAERDTSYAKAFTRYTQDLLFKGMTTKFGKSN